MRPRIGSLRLEHLPPARPGVAQGGRRVAGAADVVVAGREVEREVDRGGEPLVPVLLEQELVGAVEELARRQRAQQSAQGPAQQQGAGAGALPLAGDVDDRHLEPVPRRARRRRSRPRTGCPRPTAARWRRTTPSGRSGMPPWRRIRSRRSTNIDLALDAGHPEARAAEGGQQHDEPEAEDDDDGEGDAEADVLARHDQGQDEEHEQRRTTAAAADRAPGSTAPSAPAGSRAGRTRSNQPDGDGRSAASRRRAAPGCANPAGPAGSRLHGAMENSCSSPSCSPSPLGGRSVGPATGTSADIWGTRTSCVPPAPRFAPSCRTPGRAATCAGRRRPRPRGRPCGALDPSPRACARGARCRSVRCARPRP